MPEFTDLSEWVSLAEAARRLPSVRPGKKTHIATVYRLVKKHKLPVVRRESWRFVHWPSVLAIFRPELNIDPKMFRKPKTSAWAKAILDKAGI